MGAAVVMGARGLAAAPAGWGAQCPARGGGSGAGGLAVARDRAVRPTLLLFVALLAGRPSCSQRALDGSFVPDLLQPLYEWNVNQHTTNRYVTSVRHSILTSTGSVVIQNGVGAESAGAFGREIVAGVKRVRVLDSPKERCQRFCTPEGVCTTPCARVPGQAPLRDVLSARPTAERPAIAEVRVALTAANFGRNRLHVFAYASGDACVDVLRHNATTNSTYVEQDCTPPYDDISGMVSAVLAPLSSSHSVLREVELRRLYRAGEWQEILGDFYLLPEELGSGQDVMTLFVRLGSPLATVGSASLTDLTVTAIPFENVALDKGVLSHQTHMGTKSVATSNAAQDSDGRVVTVSNAQLTNGETAPDTQETWFLVDTNSPPVTVEFEVDLNVASYICSVQVAWVENGHISDWQFLVSKTAGDAEDFESVLQVSTASAGSRIEVGSPEEHWFPCVGGVRRVKLHLAKTDNHVFMLTEIAVRGYVEAVYGMCRTRCRHGGRCMFAQNPVCECVQKWGWRGPDCTTDVDECELQGGDQLAVDLSVSVPHGDCGRGDPAVSRCVNLDATFQCLCRDGYLGISTIGIGNRCADINECHTDNGGCQHICINAPGTYSCACHEGYRLSADGLRCEPHCSRPCEHGSICLEAEQCFGCDPGWCGTQPFAPPQSFPRTELTSACLIQGGAVLPRSVVHDPDRDQGRLRHVGHDEALLSRRGVLWGG